MKTKKVGGNHLIVRVSPSEVKQLQDEEIVIVSRAQLNAQLVFASMDADKVEAKKKIRIINCAIGDMLEQEKKQKTMIMGGRMTVGDVKRIFKKIDNMPSNSFAQIRA